MAGVEKWYKDYREGGYGFETYEPNEVPDLVFYSSRLRDTGNALDNFRTQVLGLAPKPYESFSGRP